MKLQAKSSRELNAALQKSARCVASKNSIAILDNVLLTQHADGGFFFTSATTESRLTIPAPLSIVEGTFKSVVLPIKFIMPFLGTLPDCTVNFTFNDDHSLTVEYCHGADDNVKTGKAQLTWLDADDFPSVAAPGEDAVKIALPMALFGDVLSKVTDFLAHNEIRPALSSLCIDISEDLSAVYFVGTDGHTLFKQTLNNDPAKNGYDFFRSGKPDKIILHSGYFKPFAAFQGCEEITVESDNHTIRFTSGNIEYICKALEGKYPNYNAVIPRGNPFFVTFDKKEMLAILKRVGLFASEADNSVILRKDGMFFNVSANNVDFSLSASDQVLLHNSQCEDGFYIAFNGVHLRPAISAVPGDTIRMELSDKTRAAVLTSDEPSSSVLALIMPVMINY